MLTQTLVSLTLFILIVILPAPKPPSMLATTGPGTPPIVPLIVRYEHQPLHLTQWISNDPQYSMIQASVGNGDVPGCEVSLTETGTGRTVYYCSSPDRARYLISMGNIARASKIDFKTVRTPGEQPLYAFGFLDEHNQPVRWRFVPASDPSERGAGLTPIPGGQAL
ncbi:MAG TPA: hypothetical protein VEZ90_00715, partial [Blastocatellia bacterium]|nr:hypothetical protein [Blastocatellia bacterium]